MVTYNPWHGCDKYSEGCLNCYVYRMDKMYGRDPKEFTITQSLELPLKKDRYGNYKYPSGTKFFTCYTSDFFIDKADYIRDKVWNVIRIRQDCNFMIITKRIDRVQQCLPIDWGYGWDNVNIVCTIENERQLEYRMPIYNFLPIKHKSLCIEPLIEDIDLDSYLRFLNRPIENIIAGGESGYGDTIRPCKEEWVIKLYNTAHKYGIPFCFKQTGTYFIRLNGKLETVARQHQMQYAQQLGYQDFSIYNL
ncbi:MAG: DUF5131 family protein [Acholeplasmatales bacterium]|nr:DUF5131 family protein [Acholeplasmatales bacterium]